MTCTDGVFGTHNAFLNDPVDTSTGLTSIGARDHDTTTGRFISVDPQLNAGDPQSMTGYAYADDNPTTNSDPTGLCATMDGPSQGHPVCAPNCVLRGSCSGSLTPPAKVGASTPPHADGAPASNLLDRPVLGLGKQPNQGQLKGMRAHGFQGIDEFTWGDAYQWLADGDAYNQNYAWQMFCQTFERMSNCATDPFDTGPAGGRPDAAHIAKGLAFFGVALLATPLIDAVGGAAVAVDAGADVAGDAIATEAVDDAGPGLASRAMSAASRVASGTRAIAGKAWDLTYGSVKAMYNSLPIAHQITTCVEAGVKAYGDFPSVPGVNTPLPAMVYALQRCLDAVYTTDPFEGFLP